MSAVANFVFSNVIKRSRSILTSNHGFVHNLWNRGFHDKVAADNLAAIIDLTATGMKIKAVNWPHHLELNHQWLRDQCRCGACYDHKSNERIIDLLSIPSDIKPVNCRIEDGNLFVSWPDGHSSKYLLDWAWRNSYNEHLKELRGRKPTLWNSENVSKMVARVTKDDFINTEEGQKDIMKSLIDFGVAFVNDVPATLEATEELVRRMAPGQHQFLGTMFHFSNAEMVHGDTAYSSDALAAHNDNTYLNEAGGLQMFHCLRHNGTGGETLLVDGFNAAQQLKDSRPDCYDILTSTPIKCRYIEPSIYYSFTAPILRLHPVSGELQQIRFNMSDRSPVSPLPSHQMAAYYEALRELVRAVRRAESEWWVKLHPGTVVIVDNWRVLHGRSSFTGLREMGGCYLARSDFHSKAKLLGLL